MIEPPRADLSRLRDALAASWDAKTAYLGSMQDGNPAFGQCYATARVVQQFLPESEIVDGEVWTGERMECHFWNVIERDGMLCHIDFTWQQFPPRSSVRSFRIRDRHTLGDSQTTIERVERLRRRVHDYLATHRQA